MGRTGKRLPWSLKPGKGHRSRADRHRDADLARQLNEEQDASTGHSRSEAPEGIEFGCDYCRDDQNRLFGHVPQVGSDERRGMILLRCPRCGALYENTPRGTDRTRRLTEAEARELFPSFSP